jgi:Zn-dependent protease/predicted transcriptional regulator
MEAGEGDRRLEPMPGRSIRIARIAGIPVGVSPWWLVIVALITWSLGASYFPEEIAGLTPAVGYLLGLTSALLLFASILAHEFGHAIVARRHGIEIEEIDLWLLGGVSKMRGEAHEPGSELRYALAGPLVTAAIAVCFAVIAVLLPAGAPRVIVALVDYQLAVNVLIFAFNLIPAFPLDGGRVLRSVLWERWGDHDRATTAAARVGRGFGYLLIALGVLEFAAGGAAGLWLSVIGVFIVVAAGAQAMSSKIEAALSGITAAQLMSAPAVSIDSSMPLGEAVAQYFLPYRYTAFPVVDGRGRAIGLLSLAVAERLAGRHETSTTTGAVAETDPALLIHESDDVAALLGVSAFVRVGRAVVVDEQRVPVGLLSITDVQRALRASALAGDRDGADRSPPARPPSAPRRETRHLAPPRGR